MDTSGPQGDARPLEDAADREAVDAELSGELLDPSTGLVGGDELGDFFGVEPCLGLLRWALTVIRSHRLRQFHQRPEVFYLVTGV
jgi:hypothetical protein